jgi:hypothetical protein
MTRELFLELHSTTHTFTTHMHTDPYEHTYANPTPMSTLEGVTIGTSLSTGTSLTI